MDIPIIEVIDYLKSCIIYYENRLRWLKKNDDVLGCSKFYQLRLVAFLFALKYVQELSKTKTFINIDDLRKDLDKLEF